VICLEARFWIGREVEKRDIRLEKDVEGSGAILAFLGVTEENRKKISVRISSRPTEIRIEQLLNNRRTLPLI